MNEKYLISVHYAKLEKSGLFTTSIDGLKIGDYVIVNTMRGQEVGVIDKEPKQIDNVRGFHDISPIVDKANDMTINRYKDNIKRGLAAVKIASQEAERLKLQMNFLFAEYMIDNAKIIITYTAEGRVDFRELLKVLAPKLHARIELKQIGTRDKAKVVGGLGPCGRGVCCCSFLQNVENVSINLAKNQQLPLNIPKLSGSCGKLMCCLAYEDETYIKEAKDYPAIGSFVTKDKEKYRVLGFNIVAKNVKCEGPNGIEFIPLSELKHEH